MMHGAARERTQNSRERGSVRIVRAMTLGNCPEHDPTDALADGACAIWQSRTKGYREQRWNPVGRAKIPPLLNHSSIGNSLFLFPKCCFFR